MTRKDYRALAGALKQAKQSGTIQDGAIELIGDVLYRDNNRFKWDTFAEACGVEA